MDNGKSARRWRHDALSSMYASKLKGRDGRDGETENSCRKKSRYYSSGPVDRERKTLVAWYGLLLMFQIRKSVVSIVALSLSLGKGHISPLSWIGNSEAWALLWRGTAILIYYFGGWSRLLSLDIKLESETTTILPFNKYAIFSGYTHHTWNAWNEAMATVQSVPFVYEREQRKPLHWSPFYLRHLRFT